MSGPIHLYKLLVTRFNDKLLNYTVNNEDMIKALNQNKDYLKLLFETLLDRDVKILEGYYVIEYFLLVSCAGINVPMFNMNEFRVCFFRFNKEFKKVRDVIDEIINIYSNQKTLIFSFFDTRSNITSPGKFRRRININLEEYINNKNENSISSNWVEYITVSFFMNIQKTKYINTSVIQEHMFEQNPNNTLSNTLNNFYALTFNLWNYYPSLIIDSSQQSRKIAMVENKFDFILSIDKKFLYVLQKNTIDFSTNEENKEIEDIDSFEIIIDKLENSDKKPKRKIMDNTSKILTFYDFVKNDQQMLVNKNQNLSKESFQNDEYNLSVNS